MTSKQLGIWDLIGTPEISVRLKDDSVFTGLFMNWTSEQDNEPDGESIMIQSGPVITEIYIADIKEIINLSKAAVS